MARVWSDGIRPQQTVQRARVIVGSERLRAVRPLSVTVTKARETKP